MGLKEEFDQLYKNNYIGDVRDKIVEWVEEKLREQEGKFVGENYTHRIYSIGYEEAIDDAIAWFGDELDRLIRTKQIDMIHTNLDKIMEDAKKKLKEK